MRVQVSGVRVRGPGSRVQGSGFRVQGSGGTDLADELHEGEGGDGREAVGEDAWSGIRLSIRPLSRKLWASRVSSEVNKEANRPGDNPGSTGWFL